MINEAAATRFIHSRALTVIVAIFGVAFSWVYFLLYGAVPTDAPGFFGAGISSLLPLGIVSWAVNAIAVLACVVVLYNLNKTYLFIREQTMLFATVFLASTFLSAKASLALGTAVPLALVVLGCTALLFGTFQRADSRGVHFLIATVLTVCSLQSYVFACYLPVFVIGAMQMQSFSFKSLLASLAGIVAPVWIAYAFGIIDLADLALPHLLNGFTALPSGIDMGYMVHLLYIVVLGTIFGIISSWTIISYRQQLRSYNGFFNLIAIATLLMMAVDLHNAYCYVVVINAMVAIQTAHFFTMRRIPNGYVVFYVLLAVDVVLSIAAGFNIVSLIKYL